MTPGEITLVPRPNPLPTDLHGWLQTFVRSTFFASFDDREADRLMLDVEDICRPDAYWSLANPGMGVKPAESTASEAEKSESHGWEIMYMRLRGLAYSPAKM